MGLHDSENLTAAQLESKSIDALHPSFMELNTARRAEMHFVLPPFPASQRASLELNELESVV